MKFASFALSVYGSWQVIFHGEVAKHFLSSGTFYYINRSNVSSSFVHFPFHFNVQSQLTLPILFFFHCFYSFCVTGNPDRPFRSMDVANKIFAGPWFGYLRMSSKYRTKNVNGVSSECRGWVAKSIVFFSLLFLWISFPCACSECFNFNGYFCLRNDFAKCFDYRIKLGAITSETLPTRRFDMRKCRNVENLPRIVDSNFGISPIFQHCAFWLNIGGNLLCGKCQ